MGIKTVHGHYSRTFEEEAGRIKKLYLEVLKIDITWTEATTIAAMRSLNTIWSDKKLKENIARLRGLS